MDWQAQGRFADLSKYLPEGEEQQFFPFIPEYLRSVNGELGALWHNTDTPLFFYRTDQVENPPQTWEELLAWAAEWRENNRGHAFTMPYQNYMQLFTGNFERLGGQWVDADGAPTAFENREILVSIMQPFVDLVQNDLVPAQAVLNDHNTQMPLVYAADVASFFGNNNMHIRALQPNLPPEEYDLWAATTLPYPEALSGQQRAYTAGGWVIAAVRRDDDPDREAAAAQWVIHSTNPTSQAVTNKAGGWLPTRPGVIENDPFYQEDTFIQTTLQALNEHGYVPPAAPAYNIIFAALTEALQSAASGESSLDDALNNAETRINAEYADLVG
ncbi:MAG: extracellular solute-binding protein [Anaerolineae bacterium]|nr:extracellular solute-binding protein [Anaerolineae bacterium]